MMDALGNKIEAIMKQRSMNFLKMAKKIRFKVIKLRSLAFVI